MSGYVICRSGCCPGCGDCYGMSIGCHRNPCRCAEPCTCPSAPHTDYPDADCPRHFAGDDLHCEDDSDPAHDAVDAHLADPCPECGQVGACGWDDEGRPLIHAVNDREDNPR